jgi:hypothetical protein
MFVNFIQYMSSDNSASKARGHGLGGQSLLFGRTDENCYFTVSIPIHQVLKTLPPGINVAKA